MEDKETNIMILRPQRQADALRVRTAVFRSDDEYRVSYNLRLCSSKLVRRASAGIAPALSLLTSPTCNRVSSLVKLAQKLPQPTESAESSRVMAGLSGAANAALLILLWAAGAAATDFCSTSPAINAPICGASPSLTSCNVPTSLNRNPGFLLGVKSNGQAGTRGTFINNSQDRAACCAACQAKANCDAWQVLEFLGCYHISSSDCSDQTFGPRSQGFVDYYGTGGTLAQARCNPGELSGHTPYVCVCRE
jgi:hypothetical protein